LAGSQIVLFRKCEVLTKTGALVRSPCTFVLLHNGEVMEITLDKKQAEVDRLENAVAEAKKQLLEAKKSMPPQVVQDYELKGKYGKVMLSELFGDKEDLIVIHNMGTGCPYCTLWADGFIGLHPHLQNRAAVIMVSPDSPEVQERFATSRGWPFKMVSVKDSSFSNDLGFYQMGEKEMGYWPGMITFKKGSDGVIYKVSSAYFGPGDDFCAVWPMLDLLDGGAKGWEPKYKY